MEWLFRLLSFLLKTLFYQYTFRRVKKSGLLVYLKALQIVRKSILLAVLLFFFLQIMLFGFVGMIVMGVWLWPTDDIQLKLWVLFGTFAFLFIVPVTGLCFALSDKVWYKMSGAEQLMTEE